MLCPLKFNQRETKPHSRPPVLEGCHCEEGACAWWEATVWDSKNPGQCSILAIARVAVGLQWGPR